MEEGREGSLISIGDRSMRAPRQTGKQPKQGKTKAGSFFFFWFYVVPGCEFLSAAAAAAASI